MVELNRKTGKREKCRHEGGDGLCSYCHYKFTLAERRIHAQGRQMREHRRDAIELALFGALLAGKKDLSEKRCIGSNFLAWLMWSLPRPRIVCLCGSTRFYETFHEANLRETLAGRIVLTIGCDFKSDAELLLAGQLTLDDKKRLDELHLRKIDIADEILVLNVGGYLGESTRREIAYASARGKRIRWWEVRPEGRALKQAAHTLSLLCEFDEVTCQQSLDRLTCYYLDGHFAPEDIATWLIGYLKEQDHTRGLVHQFYEYARAAKKRPGGTLLSN